MIERRGWERVYSPGGIKWSVLKSNASRGLKEDESERSVAWEKKV